jgi:uncharacterized sulfatase
VKTENSISRWVIGVAILLSGGLNAWGEAAPGSKPNIVILFTDDMGYADTGSYGNPYIRTPHLDRLAAQGQRWTDFYVAAPVCSPSRGALLTGQYPVRSGLYGREVAVMFPGDPNGIPAELLTLPEALKSAGYATGMFGKWHLGDSPESYPTRHGFDYWYGTPFSNDMNAAGRFPVEEVYQLRLAGESDKVMNNIRSVFLPQLLNPVNDNFDIYSVRSVAVEGGYEDEVLERPIQQPTFTRKVTEETVAFIESNRDRPFFAYVPYSMPHLPVFASDEFAGKSLRGAYGDTIEEIDWSVGRIVEALEEAGVAENTLLVFSSDNGPWQAVSIELAGSAGPLRGSKGTVYEGGVRVPGIFWWPGEIEPAVISDIGTTLDLYATALGLAGVDLPEATDGLDLSDVLMSGDNGPRSELAYYRNGLLKAYRKNQYKIHFYASESSNERLTEPELYDLHQDVGEMRNVAAQHPEVVAALLQAAEVHREATPMAEPVFDKRYVKFNAAANEQ